MFRRHALLVGVMLAGTGCSSDVAVAGEVFVQTKGGNAVKLSLVEVKAYEAARVEALIDSAAKAAGEQTNNDSAPVKAARADAQRRLDSAQARLSALTDTLVQVESRPGVMPYRQDWRENKFTPQYPGTGDRTEWVLWYRVNRAAEEALSASVQIQKELSALEHMPGFEFGAPAGMAKSDSDGRFTLTLHAGTKYLVRAAAKREIAGREHTEVWNVWLTPSRDSPRLVLANDNSMDSGSPDDATNYVRTEAFVRMRGRSLP